jgi:hypothetical protein
MATGTAFTQLQAEPPALQGEHPLIQYEPLMFQDEPSWLKSESPMLHNESSEPEDEPVYLSEHIYGKSQWLQGDPSKPNSEL